MALSTIIESCKFLDPKEEQLIDLDTGISETNLTLGNLTKIKIKLTQIPNLILDTFSSSFIVSEIGTSCFQPFFIKFLFLLSWVNINPLQF